MNRRVVVLLVLMLTLGLSRTGPAAAVVPVPGSPMGLPVPSVVAPKGPAFVPGQLLVEFRAGETLQEVHATVRAAGASVQRDFPATRVQSGDRLVLVKSATMTTSDLAASFAGDPTVVRTSPNYVRRVDVVPPDDPGLIEQWGLFKVRVPQAWETTTGAPEIVVADIDTGVDFLHPDLAANMWRNPGEIPGNGLDDDGNGYVDDVYGIDTVNHDVVPGDDYGHGTHTSGIVAAVGNNATGVAGVVGQAHIMALKFINLVGWGTDADAITCIDYVIGEKTKYGVNVVAINASWGSTDYNPFLRDAISRAGDAGIVFCAAAGNSRESNDVRPHYPASFSCSNIISVAASDSADRLAVFSNWGARSVDLAAPGVSILSTLPTLPMIGWFGTESMYGAWDGTSMAAPFVAGTVALLAAAHPDDSVGQRIERVVSTVHRVKALNGMCTSGGRLDVAAALGAGATSDDTTSPQTAVVGRDDLWHASPVHLQFYAIDDRAGSGVAYTEWRLGGEPWRKGATAVVPAPPDTARAFVVDFRSTDKAGNTEPVETCGVNIDTSEPAHSEIPGVPLPASPVFSDFLNGLAPRDVYRVALDEGESLRATVAGLPGAHFGVELYPPGTHRVAWVPPVAFSQDSEGGADLAYCAERGGTYYLDVRSFGDAGSYRMDWKISAAGVDVTPPSVTVDDWGFEWLNRPVPLTLRADDGPLGSGVSVVESSMDDGLAWAQGTHPTVPAPSDHSGDGLHLVLSRARDLAGNVGPTWVSLVAIDTTGPFTEAWGPFRPVRRGETADIRFRLTDLTALVSAQLIVESVSSGRTVAIVDLGRRRHSRPWCPGSSRRTGACAAPWRGAPTGC